MISLPTAVVETHTPKMVGSTHWYFFPIANDLRRCAYLSDGIVELGFGYPSPEVLKTCILTRIGYLDRLGSRIVWNAIRRVVSALQILKG
jgi:hypothetical protein